MSQIKYRVELSANKVRILSEGTEVISMSLSDVRIIGESTNQDGPYSDDWHLCLCEKNSWLEIPVDMLGFELFFEKLTIALNLKGQPSLANSTDFNSRVLWPEELAGKPLFKFKLKWYLFHVNQNYTEEVKKFLENSNPLG